MKFELTAYLLLALVVTSWVMFASFPHTPKYVIGNCVGFEMGPVMAQIADRREGWYVLETDVTRMEPGRDKSYVRYDVLDRDTVKMPCPPRQLRKT